MRIRERFERCGIAAAAGLLLSGAVGCGSETATPQVDGDVTTAYEALVSDIAACGAEVAQCARAAQGDRAALMQCRDRLQDCAAAGSDAVGALADAAGQCAQSLRECITGGGDPASCQADLQACIGTGSGSGTGGPSVAPPAVDVPDAAAGVLDCVADLTACIGGGSDPMLCAQQVRACVLDALPTPADLVPDNPGAGAPGAPGGPGGAEPPIPDDPPIPDGVPPVPPAGGGAAPPVPDPADSPVPDPADLPEPAAAAVGCLEALQACVKAGTPPPTCLQQMRECVTSVAP